MRRRALLYAVLALAVPVPAFALSLAASGSPAHPGSLQSQASLDGCGIFQNQIVCKIDTTFNQVEDADSYTASVTRPDGSVADYGTVGAGGASLWVPYVGNGTYTVQIQAWGDGKDDEPPAVVASDRAKAGAGPGMVTRGRASVQTQPDTSTDATDSGSGEEGDTPEPPKTCDETSRSPEPGDGSATDPSGGGAAGPAKTTRVVATLDPKSKVTTVLEAEGQLPESLSDPAGCPPRAQP